MAQSALLVNVPTRRFVLNPSASSVNGSTDRPALQRIEHSGYNRFILHQIPVRYDDYGFELDEDDEDEDADKEAALKNPYSEVTIESMSLSPLLHDHAKEGSSQSY